MRRRLANVARIRSADFKHMVNLPLTAWRGLTAGFRAFDLPLTDVPNLVPSGRYLGAAIAQSRFAADSVLEGTRFELAVPLRWTALRSEVVEEAFRSARNDDRSRRQRPVVSARSAR